MNKPLLLFVGPSGSGKTTIANVLEEQHGYKQVQSYTTRPPRYEGESGHIFVSTDEFNNLGELAAYTVYNGNKYGTTVKQLDECDIYVIDIAGVKTLLKNYTADRPICVVYFDTSVYTRINRMLGRHDHDAAIISRLLEDEKYDWLQELNKTIYRANRDVKIFTVNANKNQLEVVDEILWYLN